MSFRESKITSTSSLVITGIATVSLSSTAWAQSQPINPPSGAEGRLETLQTVVVTAEKRTENIQNVAMSITAVSGEQLRSLGVNDPTQLTKVVPGLTVTQLTYGGLVYTLRGVGFDDTSLAAGPTVGLYVDQVPIPYSVLSLGAGLDAGRVEVLKGPQGTLWGMNSTGGAINYVPNRPTDELRAGTSFSYGRFDDADISGYLSGPVANGFDMRAAVRVHESGPWQKSYAPQAPQSIGGQDFVNGRISALWKPGDRFKALLTLSGWRDRGYSQEPQYAGFTEDSRTPASFLSPGILSFPTAPHDDRAADFNSCVNTSPLDPIVGQANGAQWLTPTGALMSIGPGSAVRAGGQPAICEQPRKDNTYYNAALSMDKEVSSEVTLSSLTSYQHFARHQPVDMSGIPYQIYQSVLLGSVSFFYQELRLAGQFGSAGHWLVGANYAKTRSLDTSLEAYGAASYTPTIHHNDGSPDALTDLEAGSPTSADGVSTSHVRAFGFESDRPFNAQNISSYGVFLNGDYPIIDHLTFEGGVRFNRDNNSSDICMFDSGTGSLARAQYFAQRAFGSTSPVMPPPGGCSTIGFSSTNYNPPPGGFVQHLDENNVSWRAGLKWQPTSQALLYANVSKGYKSGSFPTLPFTSATEIHPVTQESLLAYQAGFKTASFGGRLLLDGAVFYYDYANKQVLGDIVDPVYGPIAALVNVPKSSVKGFELSVRWTPVRGLTVAPAISYQSTRVETSSKNTCNPSLLSRYGIGGTCVAGHFYNFDPFGQYTDFTGDRFPNAPVWQPSVDVQYDFAFSQEDSVYIGAHYAYNSQAYGGLLNRTPRQPEGEAFPDHPENPLEIKSYGMLDLRAGITNGVWNFELWGRNVTNTWYWTSAVRASDVVLHYTGMPVTYGMTFSYNFQ